MLTKSQLDQYIKDGQLVPIGTPCITIELGECEVEKHLANNAYGYKYKCVNKSGNFHSYHLDFKSNETHFKTSLLDPTPTTVESPFSKEALMAIIHDAKYVLDEFPKNGVQIRYDIISICNRLLDSTANEFPCEMKCWDNDDESHAKTFTVLGMFQGRYVVDGGWTWTVYRHARPIPPKPKELKDLVKGDKVWCKITDGVRVTFGKSYELLHNSVKELDFYDDDNLRRYWSIDEAIEDFQTEPLTTAQIEQARQSAIDEVNKRFDGMGGKDE